MVLPFTAATLNIFWLLTAFELLLKYDAGPSKGIISQLYKILLLLAPPAMLTYQMSWHEDCATSSLPWDTIWQSPALHYKTINIRIQALKFWVTGTQPQWDYVTWELHLIHNVEKDEVKVDLSYIAGGPVRWSKYSGNRFSPKLKLLQTTNPPHNPASVLLNVCEDWDILPVCKEKNDHDLTKCSQNFDHCKVEKCWTPFTHLMV